MSTPNDTRSPITDALETLGMIHSRKKSVMPSTWLLSL